MVVGSNDRFNVEEDEPTGLASIGDTLYMVGDRNAKLYKVDPMTGIATAVNDSMDRFGVNEDQA